MIIKIGNYEPKIHKTCYIAENAVLIGNVELLEKSNIWFNAILRADINKITVGKYSNIQDASVLHVSDVDEIIIGNYVTIGHGVILHGCKINDNVLVGMGAIIMNGAEIGKNSWIAAGTVIPQGKKIPENVMVMGNPYKIVREITEEEMEKATKISKKYAEKYQLLYSNN